MQFLIDAAQKLVNKISIYQDFSEEYDDLRGALEEAKVMPDAPIVISGSEIQTMRDYNEACGKLTAEQLRAGALEEKLAQSEKETAALRREIALRWENS